MTIIYRNRGKPCKLEVEPTELQAHKHIAVVPFPTREMLTTCLWKLGRIRGGELSLPQPRLTMTRPPPTRHNRHLQGRSDPSESREQKGLSRAVSRNLRHCSLLDVLDLETTTTPQNAHAPTPIPRRPRAPLKARWAFTLQPPVARALDAMQVWQATGWLQAEGAAAGAVRGLEVSESGGSLGGRLGRVVGACKPLEILELQACVSLPGILLASWPGGFDMEGQLI